MTLEKLTNKAKNVFSTIPKDSKVSAGEIFVAIKDSLGMGTILLQNFPKLKLDTKARIDINTLIKEAYYQSIKLDSMYVGTEHILLSLLKLTSSLDYHMVRSEVIKVSVFSNAIKNIEKDKKTPLLDTFGLNTNHKVLKEYERIIIPREEYYSLVSSLLQKNNPNVLLVGDKGVGKSSLIELLAVNINSLDIPPLLAGYQIIEFDLLAFMTNAFNKMGIEFGLAALSDELKISGRTILYIKNFQNIFFATNNGFTVPMFYSMFKTAIENTGVKVIASMNSVLYGKIVAENEHILEKFTVVEVDEPAEEFSLKVLAVNASYLSKYHSVVIPDEVISYVYAKARDELKDLKFPQKGLDLLDQACSRLILKNSEVPAKYKKLVDKTFLLAQNLDKNIEKGQYDVALKTRNSIKRLEDKLMAMEAEAFFPKQLKLTTVEVDEVLDAFGVEGGANDTKINPNSLNLLGITIKKKIIGQNEAVDTVVKTLIRSKLGLRSKKRPLGNFLFLGPTGVGKTELAKVLAETAFGEKSLIRLDMSDFSEKHNIARLVGAPPGYIGYGEGGELTQKIDDNPESVVLFDEIEKAHPDVLNILLQIMEEAELKDAKGNTFDFSKAVIILTSNLGTGILNEGNIGFNKEIISDESAQERLKLNLKKILKPELLNRFDEVVVFNRLKREDQLRVLNLLITEVNGSLTKQSVALNVGAPAKEILLLHGYSQEYGARSLRRTLEKELLDKIAEILLNTKKKPLKITVGAKKSALTFKVASS